MNPLGERGRAERLAAVLDGSGVGQGPLGTHAVLAERLRAMAPALEVAGTPREEFRTALRQRLVAVATVQPATAPTVAVAQPSGWATSWKAQRRIAIGAGVMATVVGLTGVAVASSRSLPGQPFYSLKRSTEGLQLQLADNDTERGSKHLDFASTRLREVQAMVSGANQLAVGTPGTPLAGGRTLAQPVAQRITETLAEFDTQTSQGRVLLERAHRTTGKSAPLQILRAFAVQQQGRLASLIPALPAGTANAAQTSLELVTRVSADAAALLEADTCTASCDPATGGPTLPPGPDPTPGTSASPTSEGTDNNGVPDCACAQPTPSPAPTQSSSPSPTPSPEPTESSSPTPSSSPSPSPSPSRTPTPLLPVPLPTILPTLLPSLPAGLPLPTSLPTLLPASAPQSTVAESITGLSR